MCFNALFFFQTFVEGHRFFEQYEMIFTALKQVADVYVRSDSSSKNLVLRVPLFLLVFKVGDGQFVKLLSMSCHRV